METTSSPGQKWGDASPGKHLGGITAEEEPWQEEKVRQSWSASSFVHPFSFYSLPSLIEHQPGLNLLFTSWTKLSVLSEALHKKHFAHAPLGVFGFLLHHWGVLSLGRGGDGEGTHACQTRGELESRWAEKTFQHDARPWDRAHCTMGGQQRTENK